MDMASPLAGHSRRLYPRTKIAPAWNVHPRRRGLRWSGLGSTRLRPGNDRHTTGSTGQAGRGGGAAGSEKAPPRRRALCPQNYDSGWGGVCRAEPDAGPD